MFLRNAFLKGVPSIFVRLKEHYLDREKVRGEGKMGGGGGGIETGGKDRMPRRRW